MSTAQRELIDFIEDQYNVPVTVEQGGKHAKLKWTYNERDYTYVVSRSRTRNIHWQVQANIVADIRRMCGQPPDPPTKTHKTLEDLMDEVRGRVVEDISDTEHHVDTSVGVLDITPHLTHEETYIAPPGEPTMSEPAPASTPTRTWPVTVTCYESRTPWKNVVSVIFPVEIIEIMPYFSIQKLDEEHWQLRPGGKRVFRLCRYGKRAMFRFLDTCAPFGAMRAEAVDVDGEILIYVPLGERPAVTKGRTLPKLNPNRYNKPVGRAPTPWEEANCDEYGSQLPAPPEDQEQEEDPVPIQTNAEVRRLRDQQAENQAAVMETVLPKLDQGNHIIQTNSLEDEMRQVLAKIRAIEDTTPYALTPRARPNGKTRWVWQAPEIE